MKKNLIAAAILSSLLSTQVVAMGNHNKDDSEHKGSNYNGHKSELTLRCVWVPDGSEAGGTYYDGIFSQLGRSSNFKLTEVIEISEEGQEACLLAAQDLPELDDEGEEADDEGLDDS